MKNNTNEWTSEDSSEYFDDSGQFELAMAQAESIQKNWL